MTPFDESPPRGAAYPMDGVKVVDVSRIIAGPLATQIMAGMGAEVVKVEAADGAGDPCRGYAAEAGGVSALFENLNRDKQSISVDLKSADGMALIIDLVSEADVFVHNFRPGVVERLGLDYASLSKVNKQLVYCGISGFGTVGPLARKAGNDVTAQAYSGVISLTGVEGGERVRCGVPIADMSAGLYAAIAILGGLYGRQQTGVGVEVSTSLLEGQLGLVAHYLIDYWITGAVPVPMGTGTVVGVPNEAYPCADGSVLIAAVSEPAWRRLCAVLSLEVDESDARFSNLSGRLANRGEVFELISGVTRGLSTSAVVEVLDKAGLTCSPINSIDQVANSEQLAALDIVQEIAGQSGTLKLLRLPISFNGERGDVREAAPPYTPWQSAQQVGEPGDR